MKFQIISDVHTEFYSINSPNFPQLKPLANNLILAGDLGSPITAQDRYIRFLHENSKKFENIFIVAGNHEFYDSNIPFTKKAIREIVNQYSNIHFLDKTRIDYEDISILGCTLWSDIQNEQKLHVKSSLADFYHIHNFTIENSNELHKQETLWLQSEIDKISTHKKILVITHHAPLLTGSSSPQFNNSKISSAFATDLTHFIKKPIVAWVFGHTHYSSRQVVNGVNVVSNQLGYPGENGTRCQDNCVIEI